MADFTILGFIEGIRYNEASVSVTLSERRLGYTKRDGTHVADEIISYRVVFKTYFKKYISSNFASGMLVKIKGILLPYAKDSEGNTIEGVTLIGQTIDREAYPKNSIRIERKMIKESQGNIDEEPDLKSFQAPDFN